MIQSEMATGKFLTTILTRETVSNVDVFPAKSNTSKTSGANIALESENAWELKTAAN
jgi:hypothetical protein